VQKWTNEHGICPKREDYPIFFATMQLPSKDNSGDKIYVQQADGEPLLDEPGHRIVEHDLFNHDGLTQDGIAEAFVEFAKKENLSFFESSSFNEGKYRVLLEGLEISVLMLSNVSKDEFRIDSEHYLKEHFFLKSILDRHCLTTIENLVSEYVTTGHTPSMKVSDFYNGDIKFIKTDNLRVNEITGDFSHTLTELGNQEIIRTFLKKRDIIVTIIGATYEIIGRSCLITEEILPANINQNIALIRIDETKANPYFISIYIGSYYGRKYLNHLSRQTEQVNLNCKEVQKLVVPIFSTGFQSKIEETVKLAHSKLEESKAAYTAAENLLLETLGLKDFQPTQQNVNIKSFKDSFLSSGRLDAEYYQLKYEEIEAKIRNSNFGFCKVKDCFSQNKSTYAKDKEGFNYIEISDISVADGNVSFNFIETPDLPANAKIKLNKGDILVSKVRPNRGAVAIINFEKEDLICSGAFTVLHQNEDSPIKNETLQIFLRTKLFSDLLLKFNCGTSYPVIKDEDILNLDIPIISPEIQTQIAEKIQTSFTLRQQSEKLLERAKRAVEIAIEESEESAMDYINS